jgi:hypothetical protein
MRAGLDTTLFNIVVFLDSEELHQLHEKPAAAFEVEFRALLRLNNKAPSAKYTDSRSASGKCTRRGHISAG